MSHRSLYPRTQVLARLTDELVTKQSHKDECDIHKILSQYKRTGIIAHINSRQPVFADLPDQHDYQDAIEVVRDAQGAFAELPATVRDQFDNDPFKLLEAIGNPERHAQLRELGIMKPAPAAPATDAPPPPPPAA